MSTNAAVMEGEAVGKSPSKGLNIALWIVQGLLALAFGMAGVFKLVTPLPQLMEKMTWVAAVGPAVVRFIGASELLGALGMVLPAVTRIRPSLTALAGAGLVLVMLLAMAFHVSRGEYFALPTNLALGSLAAFVAWGRFRKAPITPRGQA
jgi:putative oxidoreductase